MNKILTYLTDLENNNNRSWYISHKEQRIAAEKEFEELLQELILDLGKVDKSILFNNPKDLTFKLVRDTRFSKDKSPYNPTFRAHIASKAKLPIPVGYFIAIKTNNQSFLGGGLFAADFAVKGTALKKIPQCYNDNSSMKEYLKNKSWYVEYRLCDEALVNFEMPEFESV